MIEHNRRHRVVKAETEEERRAIRTKIVQEAMKTGLSEEDAYLVLDLVQHAKMKAYDTINEVSKTAPKHLQELIQYEALLHLRDVTSESEDEIKKGLAISTFKAIVMSQAIQATKKREAEGK